MRAGRLTAAATAAIAVALCVPAGAVASIVSAPGGAIRYDAAPGEQNVVTFERADNGLIRITDSGATIVASSDCTVEAGGKAAVCSGYALEVHLGDGDDSVDSPSPLPYSQAKLYGEAGDDTLISSGGVLDGGSGNDTIETSKLADIAEGGEGDDVLRSTGGGELRGGPGNDRLSGTSNVKAFEGGDGNDVIEDVQATSAPADCSFCPLGNLGANGGAGDDTLIGASTGEHLNGGDGADVIVGGGGDDHIDGGAGNDSIALGAPGPTPSYPYAEVPWGSVEVDAVATGGDGDDVLSGAAGRDHLDGGAGNDSLDSGGGDDVLEGGAGDDTLRGGEGDDYLYGGEGRDLIDGGPGSADRVDLSNATQAVDIDLTKPGGDGHSGEDDTYLPSVESFRLTALGDRFKAGATGVTVDGDLGSDVLIGGPGPDDLTGDTEYRMAEPGAPFGRDTLVGGGGNDHMSGGIGSDTLRGGPGNDILDGGGSLARWGAERTRYPSDDVLDGGPGNDGIARGWRVNGGPGDDSIDLVDFEGVNHSPVLPIGRDGDARCGSGNDVASGDYYDGIALDCEHVWNGTSAWPSGRPDGAGRVTLTVRCAWRYGASCRGTALLVEDAAVVEQHYAFPGYGVVRSFSAPRGCRVLAQGETLGARRFRIRSGRVGRVVIELGSRERRALARANCLLTRATVRSQDPRGFVHETTRTLALRAGGR